MGTFIPHGPLLTIGKSTEQNPPDWGIARPRPTRPRRVPVRRRESHLEFARARDRYDSSWNFREWGS